MANQILKTYISALSLGLVLAIFATGCMSDTEKSSKPQGATVKSSPATEPGSEVCASYTKNEFEVFVAHLFDANQIALEDWGPLPDDIDKKIESLIGICTFDALRKARTWGIFRFRDFTNSLMTEEVIDMSDERRINIHVENYRISRAFTG